MKIAGQEFKTRTLVEVIVALVLFIAIAIFWGTTLAVVFGLFALAFLLDVDPVVAYVISLVILVLCALMMLLSQKEAAKILAMWSYWLLAIGIAVQVYHFLRAGPEHGDDEAG
jgi:hypothetical protein